MTKKFVKSIDKDICQCYSNDDKKSCQRSNEYAITKSVKRTSVQDENQSDRAWKACRGIETDYQSDRERRLFTVSGTGIEAGEDLRGSGRRHISV